MRGSSGIDTAKAQRGSRRCGRRDGRRPRGLGSASSTSRSRCPGWSRRRTRRSRPTEFATAGEPVAAGGRGARAPSPRTPPHWSTSTTSCCRAASRPSTPRWLRGAVTLHDVVAFEHHVRARDVQRGCRRRVRARPTASISRHRSICTAGRPTPMETRGGVASRLGDEPADLQRRLPVAAPDPLRAVDRARPSAAPAARDRARTWRVVRPEVVAVPRGRPDLRDRAAASAAREVDRGPAREPPRRRARPRPPARRRVRRRRRRARSSACAPTSRSTPARTRSCRVQPSPAA